MKSHFPKKWALVFLKKKSRSKIGRPLDHHVHVGRSIWLSAGETEKTFDLLTSREDQKCHCKYTCGCGSHKRRIYRFDPLQGTIIVCWQTWCNDKKAWKLYNSSDPVPFRNFPIPVHHETSIFPHGIEIARPDLWSLDLFNHSLKIHVDQGVREKKLGKSVNFIVGSYQAIGE